MQEVMTENQRLLIRYLIASGYSEATVWKIVMGLWDEEAVIEMLRFCVEHQDATQAELLEAYSKIYSKYKTIIDSIPEWGEDEE